MSAVFEKAWFKWMMAASCLVAVGLVLTAGLVQEYFHQREIEKRELARYQAQKDYEDEFRSWMTRLYQNLKLDHFLAAYQNVKAMPPPKHNDSSRVEEFLEAVGRVGRGLLDGGFLKEAEEMFALMREFRLESEVASDALSEIDARRKFAFAKTYLQEARNLMEKKKFRAALAELQKADIELHSPRVSQLPETEAEWKVLKSLYPEARFYTWMEDARKEIEEARKAVAQNDFRRTQEKMKKAAQLVGRSAFIKPDSPEVEELRVQLQNLEAGLDYAIPNSIPIWNGFRREAMGRQAGFFYLDAVEFEVDSKKDPLVKIALKYLRADDENFFIVRYRIFLADGADFFNGHFLMPKAGYHQPEEVFQVTYEQEVPEKFRGKPISRIEVKVFDHQEQVVARIMRAFKISS